MSERQRGLGRGLSALLGEPVNEAVSVAEGAALPAGILSVPVEALKALEGIASLAQKK